MRSIRDWFVSKKRFLEKLDFASKITETFHHGAEKMWQPPPKFFLPLLHQFRKCLFPLWRKHPEYSKTHQQFVFNIWGSYGQGWRITLIIISIIFTCEFWFASVTEIVYQWLDILKKVTRIMDQWLENIRGVIVIMVQWLDNLKSVTGIVYQWLDNLESVTVIMDQWLDNHKSAI